VNPLRVIQDPLALDLLVHVPVGDELDLPVPVRDRSPVSSVTVTCTGVPRSRSRSVKTAPVNRISVSVIGGEPVPAACGSVTVV
jgi:hypothetical protein